MRIGYYLVRQIAYNVCNLAKSCHVAQIADDLGDLMAVIMPPDIILHLGLCQREAMATFLWDFCPMLGDVRNSRFSCDFVLHPMLTIDRTSARP